MRLSVIIPCFNYGRFLARAIDSALTQEGVDSEVIVVDDGSTDDTAAVARTYAGRITYLYQENRGPGAARNHGVDVARGETLVFLDADDRLLPGALVRMAGVLAARRELGMVVGAHVAVRIDGRRRLWPAPALKTDRRANFEAYVAGRVRINNGACAYRRKVFDVVQFDEDIRNNEDMVLEALTLARFDCAALDAAVAEIHAHAGRQRENMHTIRDAGSKVVDKVFDHPALPPEFADLRPVFLSQHLLARSRLHYLAREYAEAKRLYREAIRVRPGNVVQLSYLRKFLRAWVREWLAGRRATVDGRQPARDKDSG